MLLGFPTRRQAFAVGYPSGFARFFGEFYGPYLRTLFLPAVSLTHQLSPNWVTQLTYGPNFHLGSIVRTKWGRSWQTHSTGGDLRHPNACNFGDQYTLLIVAAPTSTTGPRVALYQVGATTYQQGLTFNGTSAFGNSPGKFACYVNSGGGGCQTDGTPVNGTMRVYVATRDNDQAQLWVDGQKPAQTPTTKTGSNPTTASDLQIGNWTSGVYAVTGPILAAVVWGGIRLPDAILSRWNSPEAFLTDLYDGPRRVYIDAPAAVTAVTASTSDSITLTDDVTQTLGNLATASEWSGVETITSSNW